MGAIDKLHKIYTTTSGPVVWARTVGLEVVNELDSVKAALMLAAGAGTEKVEKGTVGWNLAARGVEILAAGANFGGGLVRKILKTR